jgi:hypothetical protein
MGGHGVTTPFGVSIGGIRIRLFYIISDPCGEKE